jgi:mRNA-degrading endonuclease RelE of RelBE toxin-antitoxin system
VEHTKAITVEEVDPFDVTARRAGLTERERKELTDFVAHNPEAGDLIPDTGGLRKLRWAGKGKGKRGGYRLIYFFFNEGVPIFLLAIYPKNQQVDLTPEQKKRLTALATELKTEARVRQIPRKVTG